MAGMMRITRGCRSCCNCCLLHCIVRARWSQRGALTDPDIVIAHEIFISLLLQQQNAPRERLLEHSELLVTLAKGSFEASDRLRGVSRLSLDTRRCNFLL